MSVRLLVAVLAMAVSLAAAPAAFAIHGSWPPRPDAGTLFVHYGEEHWDDEDGLQIFPKVVEESIRYRPVAVFTSADKSSDGTVENLQRWRSIMEPYDAAGIPYFAAVGNHDRKAKPGFPKGVDSTGSLANYIDVFRGRPYPFGDAPPVGDPRFAPRVRPADDPEGAASHYALDVANTRWVFLDNSCFSFLNCDPLQNPASRSGPSAQLEFLEQQARAAKAAGRQVFVVMHMPTQDPRPEHTEPTPAPHNMGEGSSPENATFEQLAARLKLDGVFAGHIKGQWVYRAGGVPYFIDGGAGGEVYVGRFEKPGVDYGYWHGFRLFHVGADGRITTDAVPIFRPRTLEVSGPERVSRGRTERWTARGEQLTDHGPEVVLELREPRADRPNRENLPTPAHIWTTSNAEVLRPVAGDDEDPRRVAARQTETGRFEAVCPGRAAIVVTAGHDGRAQVVTVPSADGPLLRAVRRRARTIQRGRSTPVLGVRLAQPARVHVRVRRGGRTIRTLVRRCAGAGTVTVAWNGNGRRRTAALGRYTIEARILSDRAPVVRRTAVRTVR